MQYLTKDNVELVLAAFGALSAFLGAVSHLPLGKVAVVAGELGTDIAGAIKAVKGEK